MICGFGNSFFHGINYWGRGRDIRIADAEVYKISVFFYRLLFHFVYRSKEIRRGVLNPGSWEQAKNSLESLGKIEKDNPLVYLKLGDTYQRMGKTVDAIAAYHQSAWIFTKHGFIQKALALYKIILRIDSYNEEAINRSKELMI